MNADTIAVYEIGNAIENRESANVYANILAERENANPIKTRTSKSTFLI